MIPRAPVSEILTQVTGRSYRLKDVSLGGDEGKEGQG